MLQGRSQGEGAEGEERKAGWGAARRPDTVGPPPPGLTSTSWGSGSSSSRPGKWSRRREGERGILVGRPPPAHAVPVLRGPRHVTKGIGQCSLIALALEARGLLLEGRIPVSSLQGAEGLGPLRAGFSSTGGEAPGFRGRGPVSPSPWPDHQDRWLRNPHCPGTLILTPVP